MNVMYQLQPGGIVIISTVGMITDTSPKYDEHSLLLALKNAKEERAVFADDRRDSARR